MKPVIGITPSPSVDEMGHGAFYRYCLSRTYVDSVRAAGGIPMILPTDVAEIEETLSHLDGLLLSGGGDLEPARFGDLEQHAATYGIDEQRDQFEIEAFRAAADRDLPTLCICRGIQVMAVAQGGTLYQDIPTELAGALEHRQHNAGRMRDDVGHTVTIKEGNPLANAMANLAPEVNSFHHQSVKAPGDDLEVIATSADGVIEGLWHPGMRFGIGVQWHPEMLSHLRPEHAAIFQAFVAEAARVPVSR